MLGAIKIALARRAESRGRPRQRRRAVSRRTFGTRSLVSVADAERRCASHARLALVARCCRSRARVACTSLAGVGDDDVRVPVGRARRASGTLIKRWCRAPAAHCSNVEARVHGELDGARRQRADRRQPHLVARHLRAERAAAGALRRQVRARALAGRRPPDPRRGHALHRARAAARHASRQPRMRRRRSPRGDVVAVFPEGTTTDGTTLLPFQSSLLQPIVESRRPRAAGGDSLPRRRRRALRRRRRTSATRRSRARSGACAASARLVVELIASAADCRAATRTAASSRARPRASIRTALAVPAAATAPGYTRRSASLTAGERPAPQAAGIEHQHVRREHQLERRPVAADDERRARCGAPDARTTGGSRRARAPRPRFSRNSIAPSAVQKRSRVQTLTIARRRS